MSGEPKSDYLLKRRLPLATPPTLKIPGRQMWKEKNLSTHFAIDVLKKGRLLMSAGQRDD